MESTGNRDASWAARFKPTRAGIINLWDYRDEEFSFADGRLVLRGPNGSGKTKALEVLFPFVFDGRIEPRRLNPFAGEERTMKSNLLYRGQESAHSYVWMEFCRGSKADPEAVTVGIGMRAARHTDRVTRWYFVADGRVGVDFSLLGDDDRPLTRKQLVEQLGADAITERPGDYRAAVDARLFGLGSERYEQLINLILTLRRPQLAKNLDPKGLSQALSDGLRPLDDTLLVEVARSFSDMDEVGRALAGLGRADDATRAFLDDYTRYVGVLAHDAAEGVTRRLDQVRSATAALGRARAAREDAHRLRGSAEARAQACERDLERLRTELEMLTHSTAYEGKQQLDKLSELVGKLERAAMSAAKQAEGAGQALHRRTEEAERAAAAASSSTAALGTAAAALADAAVDAGIDWTAADVDGPDVASAEQLALRVRARVEERTADVAAVRDALTAVSRATSERDRSERAVVRAREHADGAQREIELAEERVGAARASADEQLRTWWSRQEHVVDGLVEGLDLPGLLQGCLAHAGDPDEPGPAAAFAAALAPGLSVLRDELVQLDTRRGELVTQVEAMETDLKQIADEHDDAPPVPVGRAGDRTGLSGAPLWKLVRFAEGVDRVWAAGIEAALEAAGLLDGWITTAEEAAAAEGSQQFLVPLPEADRPAEPTLAAVLVAEEDTGVDVDLVNAVLASIALCESGAELSVSVVPTIAADGRFREGVRTGAHQKADAEYVGATARERRRRARLRELETAIDESHARIRDLSAEIDRSNRRLDAAQAAGDALPKVGPIVAALRRLSEAAGALRTRGDAVGAAQAEHDHAIVELTAASTALREVSARRSAPDTAEGLTSLTAGIDHFRSTGEQLARARRDSAVAAERAQESAGRVEEARANAEELAGEAASAESEHRAQAEGLATLRAAVGADADQIDADIARARAEIERARRDVAEAVAEKERAVEAVGQAGGDCAGAQEALRSAIVEAQTEARTLAPFARRDLLDLLAVADVFTWPVTAASWSDPERLIAQHDSTLTGGEPLGAFEVLPPEVLALHRTLSEATSTLSVSESTRKAVRSKLSGALGELEVQLSSAREDFRLEWDSPDGVIVVRVEDEHGYASIAEFARRVAQARADQELLLTDAERRILEDALLTGLAQQIHERTVEARELIAQMGAEMRARHMSSGATIGVHWLLADGLDDAQRQVCKLLDRDTSALAADELSEIRGHFAARIRQGRAAHPERSYPEILAEVLDYRRWRVFAFTLIAPDGSEDRLTQARHSALSGGEQSVSLHLPLFAAAHAMLSSADPQSPRLLALDEAFAGVDDIGRGELLGLSVQFDLDLFMTGYDLWITYGHVPGCAHYDLAHSSAERTVSAALMVWDGAGLLAEHSGADLRTALGSPNRRRVVPEIVDGLEFETTA